MLNALRHDSLFWRKLARFGATRGPEWWLRYSPAFFGYAAAIAVPSARRKVIENLRLIHGGPREPLREAVDVARTFAAYAECLAEVLSAGSKNERLPDAALFGEHHVDDALAHKRGIVLTTMHTAGWETAGPLLSREHMTEIVMVMAKEEQEDAKRLQDAARGALGLRVAHLEGDPLASLGLLKHLKKGGVVALQLDRAPPGMRTRSVTLFDAPGQIPEGPLRLAAASGAPILPIFCARTGYRRYLIDVRPPIVMPRRPTEPQLDAAAQALADEMTRFLRKHPTQWFHFGREEAHAAAAGHATTEAHPANAAATAQKQA